MGSRGSGTPTQLNGELMNRATGLDKSYAPYKENVPAIQDLFGGQTPVLIEAGTVLLRQVKGGTR